MNRTARIDRNTRETRIAAEINLDGSGKSDIATGIGFFDHMLDQLARHGLFDIALKAEGDLHIDQHHTVEDSGIALGEAFRQALGDKKGITRYGHAYVPMDETLSRVALDISNRPYLVWQVTFTRDEIGGMDAELFREWFHAFAQAAGITLHVTNLYGVNNHHIVESCYKALARALKEAVALDPRQAGMVPSTKGTLGSALGNSLGNALGETEPLTAHL